MQSCNLNERVKNENPMRMYSLATAAATQSVSLGRSTAWQVIEEGKT
jgi:hypothetical protein